jgi:hypothetical protein
VRWIRSLRKRGGTNFQPERIRIGGGVHQLSGNSPRVEVVHSPEAHSVHTCAPALSNSMGLGDHTWERLLCFYRVCI